VDQLQRIAEGRNLDLRLFLKEYEMVTESQRLQIRERRDAALEEPTSAGSDRRRRITLEVIDDAWSDFLASVAELRSGTAWLSSGREEPARVVSAGCARDVRRDDGVDCG
jgi:preprotein translocase subunit SecA